MELNFDKYTQPLKKTANSIGGEQIQMIVDLTGKPYKQIAGLTSHLGVDQMYQLYKESKGSPQLWWYIFKTKYKKNNMEQIIKEKLEIHKAFRERSTRGKYLTILVLREMNSDNKELPLDRYSEFAIKYASYERAWRDILLKNPHLQGSDYSEISLI